MGAQPAAQDKTIKLKLILKLQPKLIFSILFTLVFKIDTFNTLLNFNFLTSRLDIIINTFWLFDDFKT